MTNGSLNPVTILVWVELNFCNNSLFDFSRLSIFPDICFTVCISSWINKLSLFVFFISSISFNCSFSNSILFVSLLLKYLILLFIISINLLYVRFLPIRNNSSSVSWPFKSLTLSHFIISLLCRKLSKSLLLLTAKQSNNKHSSYLLLCSLYLSLIPLRLSPSFIIYCPFSNDFTLIM